MKLDWLKPEKVVVLWHIAVIGTRGLHNRLLRCLRGRQLDDLVCTAGLSAVYAEVQGDITFQAANNQTRVPDPLPGHKQILDDGHDHSECGYNTAVKPWMQHNLAIFNVGKEASDRMARSGVSAQTGDTVSAEPSPIRIHTEFQLTDMEDYSKR